MFFRCQNLKMCSRPISHHHDEAIKVGKKLVYKECLVSIPDCIVKQFCNESKSLVKILRACHALLEIIWKTKEERRGKNLYLF